MHQPLSEFVQQVPVFVVAHRGDATHAPENTFAAFQRAVDAGIPMIEFDVQLSADSQLVVIHDATLDRTTNGSGAVHHYTVQQLRQLDAGMWFAPEFADQKILLLEEMLELFSTRCYLNIEIKPPVLPEHFPHKAQRAAEIVASYRAFPYVLFSSFHYPSLQWLVQHFPEAVVAPIRTPTDSTLPSQLTMQCRTSVFVADLSTITDNDVADIRRHRLYAAYYTVNTAEQLHRALQCCATALVSDNPVKIQRLLKSY